MSTNYTQQLTGDDLANYLMERFNRPIETIQDDEDEGTLTDMETITEYEAYQRYDDMLNECYPEVDICGYTYTPSHALKEVDPIAYRVGFNDFVSDLESEHNIIVE